MSIDTPANKEWIKKWHTFIKNPKRTFNDPMEATVIGFHLWSRRWRRRARLILRR